VAHPLLRAFQTGSFRSEVRRALETGSGLYRQTWPIDVQTAAELAGGVLAWCREAVSETHRPYGLDHVTVGVAVFACDGSEFASANFGVVRPIDFYNDDMERRLAAMFHGWTRARVFERNGGGHVSAVLFSWGDLAHDLLAPA